jgi:hypothetical protein
MPGPPFRPLTCCSIPTEAKRRCSYTGASLYYPISEVIVNWLLVFLRRSLGLGTFAPIRRHIFTYCRFIGNPIAPYFDPPHSPGTHQETQVILRQPTNLCSFSQGNKTLSSSLIIIISLIIGHVRKSTIPRSIWQFGGARPLHPQPNKKSRGVPRLGGEYLFGSGEPGSPGLSSDS